MAIKPVSQKGEYRVGKLNNNTMNKFKKISILLVIVLALLSSCSKDDSASTPAAAATFTATDLTAKIPSSLKTKSPETSAQIDDMIALMGIGDAFKLSKPTTKTSGKTSGDTWTSGGFTIKYTGSDNATQHLYTYTISQGSVLYYTLTGWDNINGSAGHWVLDFSAAATAGQGSINVDFDWIKNSSNDYNLDMVIVAGTESAHLIANINHDSSGDLKGYNGSVLSFKSNWNANGSGQYVDYETNPATITNF